MKLLKMTDKTTKIIVVVGIIGISLIFLSTLLSGNEKKLPEDSEKDALITLSKSTKEYQQGLEEEMQLMLESIKGVGKASVTITLRQGEENIYVTEENLDLDTTDEQKQRRSSEKKTLLVEDENGRKTALLRTTLPPVVSGVVAVCEGGGSIDVISSVTEALGAALSLNSTRICVMEAKPRA